MLTSTSWLLAPRARSSMRPRAGCEQRRASPCAIAVKKSDAYSVALITTSASNRPCSVAEVVVDS